MTIYRYYSFNSLDEFKRKLILAELKAIDENVIDLKTEKCYHVEVTENLSETDENLLLWIFKNSQDNNGIKKTSFFNDNKDNELMIEVGPRFNFSTADSTNSVSICHSVNLKMVKRIETSIRYLIKFTGQVPMNKQDELLDHLSDRMTQCRYTNDNIPKNSFDEQLPKESESWYYVPVMKHGRKALEDVNRTLRLAFDDWDLDFYTDLFQNQLKRDPTNVEIFDCAQSNSEHSRHWFFKGKLIVDGQEQEESLIRMIINTQKQTNQNNTIKFSDNSSAIKGFTHNTMRPTSWSGPGKMIIKETTSDLIFTAETHNMPTAVAPFSGATTGTGGRIRDVEGVGRGGLTIAGTAGYCVGNLNIPNYKLPYENSNLKYPPSFANPLKIIIEASNGASDYGNKFGEPVISGFAVSYGVCEQNRDEFVKPIMFSGGLGIMDATQTVKMDPKKGMLLAKIGGPVYRIGVGGGAASSVEVQGGTKSELDFNAVQRGDAEMENKLNRVVRACVEMGDKNPILAIHDQGAGGNGNVLKELVEPGYAGAVIFTKEFELGDPTINVLELWGAEYQENNAILCKPEDRKTLEEICARERCPINFVGIVTGNGFVTLIESEANFERYLNSDASNIDNAPFNMHLKDILGDMPQKRFILNREKKELKSLDLPDVNYEKMMELVLSVMSVGSKRFLTNKVDRCVTGLIAQQQCVGPLHTPISDYACTLISHFGYEGIATSIGTQPVKGLINAEAGARMSVAEALSNLVFVGISELADIKCSGNWMWAAKLPGEGAKLFDACRAMCKMMNNLKIAIDGGKDSLSMAARIGNELVKSPSTLVISTYAPCPDVRIKVTPDLKSPARNHVGKLVWVNIELKFRLGGSAFAQSLGQKGNDCPDLNDCETLENAFKTTQVLLKQGKLLAGHDISDGGLLVCLVEMAIGGMCGIHVDLSEIVSSIEDNPIYSKHPELNVLFAEECGWVLEVSQENLQNVLNEFKIANVPAFCIGESVGYGMISQIDIRVGNQTLIQTTCLNALKLWERTSFEIEKLQMNPECAIQEYNSYDYRTGPKHHLSFNPDEINIEKRLATPVRVAVIREEGVNGDREMMAALMKAQFEVHDVTMSDLLSLKTSLDQYRGVIFPGGFSYADTLGSAKGWAAGIAGSKLLAPQFKHFRNRSDTFSLGVCNGCQLMSLIGWIGEVDSEVPSVTLNHNNSGRFECRWNTVKILNSRAIMFKNMGDSVIGCWTAHGEGNFKFASKNTLSQLKASNCIAMQYVDDEQNPTEIYPMNPNGSVEGVAGICSKDGRHLAIMPHPERCSEMILWPYIPPGINCKKSPWQTMFDQAYIWCSEN